MSRKAISVTAACATAALVATVAVVATRGEPERTEPFEAGVYVHPVEGMGDDFINGVDVSSVLSLEESGVVFRDWDGNEADLFDVLADSGVNYARVRVWNDPYDSTGVGYGGGNVGPERAVDIARRATRAGMRVLVDFHYSDFWADPGKQDEPKAWEELSADDRVAAIGEFTRTTLQSMDDAGVDVGMVQVGNETNNGVAGMTSWIDMTAAFAAGSAATRDVYPDALVAVHFTNPERDGEYVRIAKILDNFEVDYDVFASSYYPFWHGSLDNLTSVLAEVSDAYGKQVVIAETSWVYTLEDGDGHANVIETPDEATAYPVSVQGQATAVRDVMQAVADVGDAGLGVFYWEPAWLPVGPPSALADNSVLWNDFGSGWASAAAADYDPADAGVYFGGSAWENQALFDFDGYPLESLRVFDYARYGAVAPIAVTTVEQPRLRGERDKSVVLPEAVAVSYNDGHVEELPVAWQEPVVTYDAYGEYSVRGEVGDGHVVIASIAIAPRNDVVNAGFEDDDLSMWTFDSEAATFRVVDDNVPASVDLRAVNFWHDAAYSLRLAQEFSVPEPGSYRAQVSVHGIADEAVTLVVTTSAGEYRTDVTMAGWQNWQTATIDGIEVPADGAVTIAVVGDLSAGAWGFVDDLRFGPTEQ